MSNAPTSSQVRQNQQNFDKAVKFIQNLPSEGDVQLNNDQKLKFYSLYKQVTVGDAVGSRPAFYDVVVRSKWDAWNGVRGMSADDAKMKYVAALLDFLKRFPDRPFAVNIVDELEGGSEDSFDSKTEGDEARNSQQLGYSSPMSMGDDKDEAFLSAADISVALAARDLAEEEEADLTIRPKMSKDTQSRPPLSHYTDAPSSVYPSDSSRTASSNVRSSTPMGISERGVDVRRTDYFGSSVLLSEDAEAALQGLQTEVAALHERIELMRQEAEEKDIAKRNAKRGWVWLAKLCLKHAAINFTLFVIFLTILYQRESPIAMEFLALVAPKLVQTYNIGREVLGKVTGRRLTHK